MAAPSQTTGGALAAAARVLLDAGQAPWVVLLGAGQPQEAGFLRRRMHGREMSPARRRSIMLTPDIDGHSVCAPVVAPAKLVWFRRARQYRIRQSRVHVSWRVTVGSSAASGPPAHPPLLDIPAAHIAMPETARYRRMQAGWGFILASHVFWGSASRPDSFPLSRAQPPRPS